MNLPIEVYVLFYVRFDNGLYVSATGFSELFTSKLTLSNIITNDYFHVIQFSVLVPIVFILRSMDASFIDVH